MKKVNCLHEAIHRRGTREKGMSDQMEKPVYLLLENGDYFEGKSFGAPLREVTGEVVFTTGMTGYLETITDPSYFGQIVVQTFPLIGNYGVIPQDFENEEVYLSAYIVKRVVSGTFQLQMQWGS